MTKPTAAHLKLHVEPSLSSNAPWCAGQAALESLCHAFEQATGWRMRYEQHSGDLGEPWSAPIDGGNGRPGGKLVLAPALRQPADSDTERPRTAIPLENARPLALAVGGILAEMNRLQYAIREREAELAAGVPITARPDDEQHLADRLQAVLKGGAEAVNCPAAALYLLDDATTSLKLRAAYGLPAGRLLDDPRPLRGAVADLEALVGHAVVLEDTSLLPHWKAPEDFPAAVCVPVSSSTAPLGTLWVFSDESRDFTAEETNLIEIVAGRLASDLEREMLIATGTELKQLDKQVEQAARWQHDRLPSVMPLVDRLEIAGWTEQAEGIGGDFHDWTVLPDSRLAIAVADAQGTLVEAGLNAASLHAALKSHCGYRHSASQLLQRLNDTLWTASAGDQFASLAYGLIHPDTSAVELALAGQVMAVLVQHGEYKLLTAKAPALGTGPDTRYKSLRFTLNPADLLVVLSPGVRNAVDEAGLHIGEMTITATVQRHCHESASAIVSDLRRLLDRTGGPLADDMTVLVLKRKPE